MIKQKSLKLIEQTLFKEILETNNFAKSKNLEI